MSEAAGDTAGALLRAARQKQGLHIAALAASIKVAPAKLEALEAGRYDELPDATFTRALAQSVCRALKIDAQPVLARLPSGTPVALERVDAGLNAPFRERPPRVAPVEWLVPRQPVAWLVLLLLLAAAAFVLAPGHWFERWWPGQGGTREVSAPAAGPGQAVEAVKTPLPAASATAMAGLSPPPASPASIATAPAPAAVAATPSAPAIDAPPVPAPRPAAASQLVAREATWVQATDGRGQVLLSRTLQAGEVVELTGERPLRLRIGNVRGTELVDRGQPVDIAARTRDNVLNIELP